MTFGPIETERLRIRRPEIGDTEALFERRNHPDAARYQDWPYPYPMESARKATAATSTMDGPTEDEWWMVTIVERASGAIVGDIGLHQSWQGRSAEIGYTLHPDHWGQGFATEAVSAVIDTLIERGIQRISASTAPENWASNRLLELLGFQYEGRAVGAYFDDRDGPATEAEDGLLFGLTAEARARWTARPMDRPDQVRFIEIDETNHREVARLETHYHQRHLVAPVAASYGNALFPATVDGRVIEPWLRAIEIDGSTLAGFVMVNNPGDAGGEPYLWRLLIDRWHQRRGIASAILDQLESDLAAEGHRAVTVHWAPGPGSPGAFYQARGYELTGKSLHGEVEGRKQLG